MIRATLLLVRTSLPAVTLLAAALFGLVTVLSDEPDPPAANLAGSIPSLAPLSRSKATAGTGSAVRQNAMFDPGHRAETISGSIDDLRSGGQPATVSPVTIAGVLVSGGTRKAMLSLDGAAPSWSGVGDERGGWRVLAVDGEGAVLERDGQSVTLKVADRYKLRGKTQSDAGAPASGQPAVDEAQGRPSPGDLPAPDP